MVSDIHSFYDELIAGLDKAGFDITNEKHILIVVGDIFDRGKKPLEVYHFLKSLPKERRILIRGNHESLLKQLYIKEYAGDHDYTNGTVDTIFYLNKMLGCKEYDLWWASRLEKPLAEIEKKYSGLKVSNFLEYYEARSKIMQRKYLASIKRFKKALRSKQLIEILQ